MRAKYLDWCSAKLADEFLALSPDEIFELGERATRGDSTVSARSLSVLLQEDDEDLSSYRALVERVTEVLAQQIELPSYEQWLMLYEADHEAVEARLLGFWREQARE